MQEIESGVLIAGRQDNQAAQYEFDRLRGSITKGEVRGLVFDEHLPDEMKGGSHGPSLARGAMWGALVGLGIGLIPLFASVITAAGAGMLVVRASQIRVSAAAPRIRVEGITAPRIHIKQQ